MSKFRKHAWIKIHISKAVWEMGLASIRRHCAWKTSHCPLSEMYISQTFTSKYVRGHLNIVTIVVFSSLVLLQNIGIDTGAELPANQKSTTRKGDDEDSEKNDCNSWKKYSYCPMHMWSGTAIHDTKEREEWCLVLWNNYRRNKTCWTSRRKWTR